ncbi:unnamed protein product [Rotaria sp. Silwood2]|nr:unnamed protein product [Rotaria sp. Silwood2]
MHDAGFENVTRLDEYFYQPVFIDIRSFTQHFKEKKSNEPELWPLTTTNNPSIYTIDDQDMDSNDVEQKSNDKKRQKKTKRTIIDTDLLIDRYNLTQKANRENFDTRQYSSEDEDQPQSPYSPDNIWQQEEDDEDEDL